ncbi:unnamed protein product [Phyllotreta striolata]|uniref:Glycosyl transferase CAP10 domain-containing protein n=1 Tax=Phyllotreta striolata TaxID=444603 RepID=A0A9N9TDP6_PHYSR|nr:unnamed protein product [Phyllotreta striolata]
MKCLCKLLLLCLLLKKVCLISTNDNVEFSEVWGPGLKPDQIVMPARYFFIKLAHNPSNKSDISKSKLLVEIDGESKNRKHCRVWTNVLDRNDGSFIVRYKLYEFCSSLKISIRYDNKHLADSPYVINEQILSDDCNCPTQKIEEVLNNWECGPVPDLIKTSLDEFGPIDWNIKRKSVIKKFDQPYSVSLCHYVVKNNNIYRKCYGKHVGFNMFVDNILLSLTRKTILPDIEFFSNLGDWPLSARNLNEKYPIFSWCGSTDSYDIILPTYDITESTLENMGRVSLDILSVQGNSNIEWENRIPRLFWRGRDSNKYRLELIKIARNNPDLFNASLTNFFFYKDEEEIYGPKAEYVSFFKFFDYKYQLGIDGTVAAYRMPYLLAGGSVLFKPASKYYEYFYKDLKPYVHYIPVKEDISDIVEKIKWAIDHDEEAKAIAENSRRFINEHLLPKNIFCYHMHMFNEFSKVLTSRVQVLEGMEAVKQKTVVNCDCNIKKDEL